MLIKRYLVFVSPIVLGVILEGFILFPRMIYLSLGLGLLWIFGVLFYVIKDTLFTKQFLYFVVPPLSLLLATVMVILFFERALMRHLFNWGYVLLLMLYLENLFIYYYSPEKYQAYSLENISKTYAFISSFLFISGLYGFSILVGIPLWIISLVLIGWVILLTQQIFWVSGISRSGSMFYSIIIAIIVFEFLWVLAFLPIDLYVYGLIMALLMYLLTELTRDKLLEKEVNKKMLTWVSSVAVITLSMAVVFSII